MSGICQSCSQPLSKDPAGGGTNANGSGSSTYCSFCYRDGRFTEPQLTCEEMVARVRAKMKEMRVPGVLAWWFARRVPRLERWRA
jgi:hypothetical protein